MKKFFIAWLIASLVMFIFVTSLDMLNASIFDLHRMPLRAGWGGAIGFALTIFFWPDADGKKDLPADEQS